MVEIVAMIDVKKRSRSGGVHHRCSSHIEKIVSWCVERGTRRKRRKWELDDLESQKIPHYLSMDRTMLLPVKGRQSGRLWMVGESNLHSTCWHMNEVFESCRALDGGSHGGTMRREVRQPFYGKRYCCGYWMGAPQRNFHLQSI